MKKELIDFLVNLNLRKYQDTFLAGGLETVNDLRGLERQDLIDIGLNMAERSRLTSALKNSQWHPTLPSNASVENANTNSPQNFEVEWSESETHTRATAPEWTEPPPENYLKDVSVSTIKTSSSSIEELTDGSLSYSQNEVERWGELATSDWLNRDNWVGGIFELTEGDDGFFKKARCTDLSDFSFKDSLILVLKRNSPDFGGNSPWGLRVLLEGRSEFDAKLYITGVESVIHITFHTHEEGVDEEYMRWCDDLDIDQAVDFIKTLNREGAIKTMKNLPLPPWRK